MALWKPTDGWDIEPDADTSEEMLQVAAQEREEYERELCRAYRAWEMRNFFGRDGRLVIVPRRGT